MHIDDSETDRPPTTPRVRCGRPVATLLMLVIARDCSLKLRASAWLVLSPYILQVGGAARLVIADILVPGWVYKCAYNESNILSSIITSRRAWQFGDHVKPQRSVAIELMLPQIHQEHHSRNAPIYACFFGISMPAVVVGPISPSAMQACAIVIWFLWLPCLKPLLCRAGPRKWENSKVFGNMG